MSTNAHKPLALITGASSGIGRSLARALAREGYNLILTARGLDKLEEAAAEMRTLGADTEIRSLDMGDVPAVEAFGQELVRAGRIPNWLILNAGLSQRAKVVDTPLDTDRKLMEINYFGPIAMTKVFLPEMGKLQAARIGVISSMVGVFGFPLRSAYSASKHALHGFYETLQLENPFPNLHVSILCPGRIRTEISLRALDENGKPTNRMDPGQANGMDPDRCAQVIISSIRKKKKLKFVGGGELLIVYINRYFRSLFYKIASRINPT